MTPGERLRALRNAANLNVEELGRRAAMAMGRPRPFSGPTVRNQENGTNGISQEQAAAYAKVLKTTASYILFGDEPATTNDATAPDGVRMVGVIGEIRAGAFAAVPADEPTPWEYVPVNLPEYQRAHLFSLKVAGASMDQVYPDGSYVVVCPAHEAGVRERDHVVVRMWRGGMAETTLKEVVVENDQIVLYPRSSDPEFQEPIRLDKARDADEGPEIIGVVVASFVSRGARAGPLLLL